MRLVYDNIANIFALCQKYGVKNMYLFGSILTSKFNDKSDIDFLVNFNPENDPLKAGDNFINLYLDLQELLGRNVDLVDESFIRNPYFKEELEETKFQIYG